MEIKLSRQQQPPPGSLLILAVTHTERLYARLRVCMSVCVGVQKKKMPKTTRFPVPKDASFSHRITKKQCKSGSANLPNCDFFSLNQVRHIHHIL